MNIRDARDRLIAELEGIVLMPEKARGVGLCEAVDRLSHDYTLMSSTRDSLVNEMDDLFMSWEDYSQNIAFPVPHPVLSPARAYMNALADGDMYQGVYGGLRLDLARHVIAGLKKK